MAIGDPEDVGPREAHFDTFGDYREAVAQVVRTAQSQLMVFDSDLAQTGLESRAGAEMLGRFLLNSRSNRLRIVLHKPETISRTCPRLTDLLRRFGHNAALRQSPGDLRELADRFVVADGRHLVVRFHTDHARGKLVLANDAETAVWQRRFDALWDVATETTAVSSLGL